MLDITLNTEQVQKRLIKLAKTIGDTKVLNRQVSIALYGIVLRNFRDSSSDGKAWSPFKAGGRWEGRGKARYLDTSAQLLLDTGALRASFAPFADANQAGVGAKNYVPKSTGGAPWDLAAIHEFGTRNIPARPMLPTLEQGLGVAIKVYDWAIKRAAKEPV